MSHLMVDGCRIRYEVEGPAAAPPLLLSNSLGTDMGLWEAQMPAFAARFRVVRYDSRGHGGSDAPPGPYTIERLGRDALALLDHLDIARAHVCGVSKGGMVGMWLGTHAPDRVDRLALCNTSPHMPPASLWDERIRTVREGGMKALTEGVLARWFTPAFREARPERLEPVRRMLLATPAEGYAACCGAIRDMDQRETIRAVRARTLVVVGEHDPATPPVHGRLIAERIPGAAVVGLPAAHLSNVEAAPAYTEAVLRFLSE